MTENPVPPIEGQPERFAKIDAVADEFRKPLTSDHNNLHKMTDVTEGIDNPPDPELLLLLPLKDGNGSELLVQKYRDGVLLHLKRASTQRSTVFELQRHEVAVLSHVLETVYHK